MDKLKRRRGTSVKGVGRALNRRKMGYFWGEEDANIPARGCRGWQKHEKTKVGRNVTLFFIVFVVLEFVRFLGRILDASERLEIRFYCLLLLNEAQFK